MKYHFPALRVLALATFGGCLCLDHSASASYAIDSLDGDITANEITSFNNSVNGLNPGTNNYNNDMATHYTGVRLQGMNRMYEATGNLTTLGDCIRFCDGILAYRNDQPLGQHIVQWTGHIEAVWPLTSTSTDAGGETGFVAAHVAQTAHLILENSAIWNNTVSNGDPYGFGATYKARALTYLTMVDQTLNNYVTKYCVVPGTFEIRNPSANPATGTIMPWNTSAMFMLPHLYSAQCHDILGDHPANLATCKAVVKAWARWFVDSATSCSCGNSAEAWFYMPPNSTANEDQGHAQHDLNGLFNAYASGYSDVTEDEMTDFSNTIRYIMSRGVDTWSDNVEGSGVNWGYLFADFLFMSEFNQPLYKMLAQSTIDANQINSGSETTKNVGYILYMKHWMYLNQGTIPPQTPNPIRVLEAESLTVAASSGDTHRIIQDTRFSGGQGTILDADAVNDYVTYLVPAVCAGTYDVKVKVKKFPTRGIVQLSVSPAGGGGGSNLGSAQDQFATTDTFTEIDLGNWTPSTAGDKLFKFTVTGKNASSSGYSMSFDYIKLTHQ